MKTTNKLKGKCQKEFKLEKQDPERICPHPKNKEGKYPDGRLFCKQCGAEEIEEKEITK